MRIVILGAGTVGTSIAEVLCNNRHSVTVVDSDPVQKQRIDDELDAQAILGSASQSSVLFQANVLDADLCLAVTGNDEVNLVAASMAKAMGARRTMARVYAPVFRDLSTFDYQGHFHIDRLISLEHEAANLLARNLRDPGSVVVEHFARGELAVQEILIPEGSPAVGNSVKELELPTNVRIGALHRTKNVSSDGQMWLAGADDRFEIGDRVTLIGQREDIDGVTENIFRPALTPKMSVVIAGGGETGYHLARILENEQFDVRLMEQSRERCDFLSHNLDHATVVNADATRRSKLEEERVGHFDVFVACTGDDENNIVAGVEAREIGTQKIMAVISRRDYAGIKEQLGIDVTVSELDGVSQQVMDFLNTGPIISRSMLPGGRIGVFEIEVLEDAAATEHVIANLDLPADCLIAVVIREDHIKVPGRDDRLQPGDTVIALIDDSAVEVTLNMFAVKED